MRDLCGVKTLSTLLILGLRFAKAQRSATPTRKIGNSVNENGLQNNTTAVSVLCTEDFIRLTAIVGRGGFFGLLRTGQGEEGCSVEGVGEAELSLWVPLRSSSSCGARPEEGGFVSLVVEVIAVAGAESASDATFLVQCESGPPSEGQEDPAAPRPVPSPLIAASLAVLLDDRPVRSALVGELVTLELSLPSPDSYRVSSCLAFSRGPERLRFLPLMDRRGCPVADLISLFGPVYGTERLRAELRLFRFNHSHDLHVQCLLESCGGKCEAPTCRQEATQGLLGARLIRQNHPESLAAQRLSVMDPPPQLPSPAERQCNYAEESDLVGLLLLFVVLSISAAVLFLTAWLNRPAELGWPAFLRSRSSAASDHSHLLPPPPAKDTAHNHSAHAQGPVQEGFSLRRKPKPPSIFHRSMPRRIRRAESVTEETRKAGVLPGSYPAGSASASSTLRSTAGSDATVDAQPTRSSNASSSPRPLPPTPPPRLCSLPALPFPSPPQMAAEAGGQGRDVGGQEEASRSPSGMARSGTPACVERGSPSVHSHDADRSVRSFFYSVSATFQNTLARLRPFSALSDRI